MNETKRNQLYANLMDEVKVRIECINSASIGEMRYPTPVVREFCWLQLRMLCELIALSCIVAHGDVSFLQSHKLGRSYSADDILSRMLKLRPHFFPIAMTQNKVGRQFEMLAVTPSPLSREALLDLYGTTHKYLHRGSIKKILSSETPRRHDQSARDSQLGATHQ